MTDALCLQIPALVKALPAEGGRRFVEVEASNESVDQEGDVILQRALLNSAKGFLARGVIDVDHISEIGDRYGITNVEDYIIGRPVEVKDLGDKRTAVKAELSVGNAKSDEVWKDLTDGSTEWRASIYGFPSMDGLVNASVDKCSEAPDATRYVVKAIDWRSLALTKTPCNDAIEHHARIVTAKAFAKARPTMFKAGSPDDKWELELAADLALMFDPYRTWYEPRTRTELLAHWTNVIQPGKAKCLPPESALFGTVAGFRSYFIINCGMEEARADIFALALARLLGN